MNTRRVIDASKGWKEMYPPESGTVQYVPKPINRVVQQPTTTVNPHANMIYANPPMPVVREQLQPQTTPAPIRPEPAPQSKKKTDNSDPSLRGFDLSGCTTIEQAYMKNAHRIKIVPE